MHKLSTHTRMKIICTKCKLGKHTKMKILASQTQGEQQHRYKLLHVNCKQIELKLLLCTKMRH